MDSRFHYLRNLTTGELWQGRFGPHDEVPPGWEMIQTELHEIPRWFPKYAVYESGELREMTSQEKAAADARRDRDEKVGQFNANRALHAAFRIFLEEINVLRLAASLEALDANGVVDRIKQEYLSP